MSELTRLGELWGTIQKWLLLLLEDELGELDDKHKEFVAACETCAPGARMTPCRWIGNGCPPKSRLALFKTFAAKAVWDFPTARALIDAMRQRPTLRRLCGWETLGEVPSEATFSRAFAAFASGVRLGDKEEQQGQAGDLARLQVEPRRHRRRHPAQLDTYLRQSPRQPGGHPSRADECPARHEPIRPRRSRRGGNAKEIREMSARLGHVAIIDHNPRRGEKRKFAPAEAARYRERACERILREVLQEVLGIILDSSVSM